MPDEPRENVPAPTGQVKVRRNAGIPQYKLDAVAMLQLSGVDATLIATQVGEKKERIDSLLAGRNSQYNAVLDGYRETTIGAIAHHQRKLLELHEGAYAAIQTALQPAAGITDKRLAVETAWKLFEHTVPKQPTESVGTKVEMNFGDQTAVVHNEISNTFHALVDAMGKIADVTPAPSQHERKGVEALPANYKVVEAETSKRAISDSLRPVQPTGNGSDSP